MELVLIWKQWFRLSKVLELRHVNFLAGLFIIYECVKLMCLNELWPLGCKVEHKAKMKGTLIVWNCGLSESGNQHWSVCFSMTSNSKSVFIVIGLYLSVHFTKLVWGVRITSVQTPHCWQLQVAKDVRCNTFWARLDRLTYGWDFLISLTKDIVQERNVLELQKSVI